MNFEITNGLGLIKIGIGNGTCFSFIRPLTFCWPCNNGSMLEFLCTLPYSEEYRNQIHHSITSNLNSDFSKDVEKLHQILLPLFALFPNGDYSLVFHNSEDGTFCKYKSFKNEVTEEFTTNWILHFGELTVAKKEDEKLKEYHDSKHQWGILNYSTYMFYPQGISFLATQPKEKINMERVKYFENEITNGKRPFIIVYDCIFPSIRLNDDRFQVDYSNSIYSDFFVLDGHHKLLAYENLQINPPVAHLRYLPKSESQIHFDINELKDYLYSWQFNHVIEDKEVKYREI